MEQDNNGKAGKSIAKVIERAKPTLVTIGSRVVVSNGRWNNDCMAEYVRAHGRDKWVSVGELARTAFSQNTPRSKERARRCLSRLFHHFLQQDELLIIEYGGPRGRAQAVKLYGPDSGSVELASIKQKLDRLRMRSEITHESYQRMLVLIDDKRAA